MRKTVSTKPHEVKRHWYIVDASNQILGHLAACVAHRLRGKHKPEYTPHVDTGDYIIVTHAEKIRITGHKASQKVYYRHSGYPGGLKQMTFEQLQAKRPTRIIELAVKGMLPKNTLGRAMYRKLKVYIGAEHPHQAQSPVILRIGDK